MTNYPTYGITPANGSLDTSFDQGSGFNKKVLGVAEYGDEYVFGMIFLMSYRGSNNGKQILDCYGNKKILYICKR